MLAAYAPNAEVLILARGLLGVAGATLMPSTLSLIRAMFPDPAQRTRAVSLWMIGFSGGMVLGPVVGGLLLERFWWGSVFLLGVPVMAVLGEVEHDEQGLAHDKTSDMATVLLRGRDGRMALLAFTSSAALQAWNPEARPVPVTAAQAAQAAVHDDAAAMVVDVAGPVLFVVEGADLRSLAEGYTLVDLNGEYAWAKAGE